MWIGVYLMNKRIGAPNVPKISEFKSEHLANEMLKFDLIKL